MIRTASRRTSNYCKCRSVAQLLDKRGWIAGEICGRQEAGVRHRLRIESTACVRRCCGEGKAVQVQVLAAGVVQKVRDMLVVFLVACVLGERLEHMFHGALDARKHPVASLRSQISETKGLQQGQRENGHRRDGSVRGPYIA